MAGKVLYGKGSVKIGGQTLSKEAIMKEAMEDGILGTGSSADYLSSLSKELGDKMSKGNPLQKVNPWSKDFVPGKVGQKASEAEDNVSRLAHYLFVRQKGGTRKVAKDSVIKHLFDYSNISTPERALRAVFPFYTWMRNNIPFQIAQAVKRPGLYNIIGDLQSSMQDEPELDPLLDEMGINRPDDRAMMQRIVAENGGVLPDYIRERYVNVEGNNYFNVGLPSSDLETIKNPVDLLRESMNPAIQWFSGISSNRNAFGAPIDQYSEDGNVGLLAGLRYTLDQFGGNPGRALGNFIPDAAGNMRISDSGILGGIGKSIGLSTTEVDPLQALRAILYRERDAAQKRKQKEKARSE